MEKQKNRVPLKINLVAGFFSGLVFAFLIFSLVNFLKLRFSLKTLNQVPESLPLNPASSSPLEEKIKSMSLEEKVGYLFMVGFNGQKLTPETKAFFQKNHFCHFLLRQGNIKDETQLKNLTSSLVYVNTGCLHPIVAIDQEGGKVERINFENIDHTSQAEIKTPKQAFEVAKSRGEKLASWGINLNFSPVLEASEDNLSYINRLARAFVIGDYQERLEETDPGSELAQLALAMVKGYEESGIISVVKHFPFGLARVKADPHQTLPIIDINQKELEQDLYPFKNLIKAYQLKAVIVTHLFYPKIDSQYPTSLSYKFTSSILRGDLGFEGVVITDDLMMKAITNKYSVSQAAKLAFLGGADLILISSNPLIQEQAYQTLVKAVEDGEISLERVEESVKRIINLISNF